jgi:hypothetical protein
MRSARIVVDCGPVTTPTGATIDQIARLQLEARRCGCNLELKNANPCLLDLIDFAGLAEVLRVEAGRQSEQREQPSGVEEERELGDPTVGQLEHL